MTLSIYVPSESEDVESDGVARHREEHQHWIETGMRTFSHIEYVQRFLCLSKIFQTQVLMEQILPTAMENIE